MCRFSTGKDASDYWCQNLPTRRIVATVPVEPPAFGNILDETQVFSDEETPDAGNKN
jgi:hypothetical protein